MQQIENGSVTSPRGFQAAGMHAGVKSDNQLKDLALVHSSIPCTAAAVYTKTRVQAALNWCLAREGGVGIPKSDSVERTVENCGASGWRLSEEQLRTLDEAAADG